MRRSNGALLIFLFVSFFSLGQDAQTNLEKYWRVRERLKNFVVTGNCFGCSIPAKERDAGSKIEWSDATIHLGYYIGMLATEHKILEQHSQPLEQNERELFYALEAINRLDLWAEYRWEEYELGINHNGLPPPFSDLNGFFIRDDIPKDENFFQQQWDGKNVREHLSSSTFPLPDIYNLNTAVSAYTVGIDQGYGPREETIDQVIQLYTGLALVSRLIPSSVIYIDESMQPVAFMDGETSLLQEARNISNRITGHIQQHSWTIVNPVMPGCTQGVCGNRSCTLGACGGGNASGLCYGFYQANCFIQQGNGCITDGQVNGNSVMWSTTYRWNALGDQDFKVLTLAAVGRVWDARTDNVLVERCINAGAEHLPLLYNVLYDAGSIMLPNLYYTDMMDEAWCAGNNGYEGPMQWRGQSRILYGPNRDNTIYSGHYNNIDYMLYFNLYILTHPSYIGSAYRVIPPAELCDAAIEKHGIAFSGNKNLYAAQSISLSNCIFQDTTFNASLSLKAGKEITLSETTVLPGSRMTALIDPLIKEYACRNNGGEGPAKLIPQPSLSAIPNPNDGTFFLYADHLAALSEYNLVIVNVLGQVIYTMEGISDDGFIQVSLPSSKGLYIAYLTNKRIVASQKIVVTGNRE